MSSLKNIAEIKMTYYKERFNSIIKTNLARGTQEAQEQRKEKQDKKVW